MWRCGGRRVHCRANDTVRVTPGGLVFHVLNRGVVRTGLFRKDADYDTLERVIEQTLKSAPLPIGAYCLDW